MVIVIHFYTSKKTILFLNTESILIYSIQRSLCRHKLILLMYPHFDYLYDIPNCLWYIFAKREAKHHVLLPVYNYLSSRKYGSPKLAGG